MTDMTTPKARGKDRDPGEPHEIRALMREILVDHAVSLDGIFTDFTDHAVEVFQDSPFASQTYLRLAMRAQTGCRTALQAVVRVDQAVEAAAAKEARAAASGLDAAIAPPAGKPARRHRPAATH